LVFSREYGNNDDFNRTFVPVLTIYVKNRKFGSYQKQLTGEGLSMASYNKSIMDLLALSAK